MIEVQEFYRLHSSLKAKQEHASLLEDFREFDRTRLDLEEGVDSQDQALLKEHASISRSTGQVIYNKICSPLRIKNAAIVFLQIGYFFKNIFYFLYLRLHHSDYRFYQ